MRSILSIILICTICVLPHLVAAQGAQVIYVKKGATGAANGTSWTDAYPELRTALAAAASISGSKEIWVARGEYKPTDGLDRSATFLLPAQAILYGGFAGNEISVASRNWKQNRTVLSGDLGIQFDKTDNSLHVVVAKDVDASSGIDGFIIVNGNADDGNAENGQGGGMLVWDTGGSSTAPKIKNCSFINNDAKIGAGVSVIGNESSSAPEFTNCIFNSNASSAAGGAFFVSSVPNATIFPSFINSTFTTNEAQLAGIGMVTGKCAFLNCTMTFNKGYGGAAGLYGTGDLILRNSIVWKNFKGDLSSPNYLDQVEAGEGSNFIVQNNIIQGGYGTETDKNIDLDPLFLKEPSFVGKYPRTSIIPVSSTEPTHENMLEFNGSPLWGPWPYYAFKDHQYNKIYLAGRNLQVLDFSNLVNNKPTSTVYDDIYFPRTIRAEESFHIAGNKVYVASYYDGLVSLDRATGQLTSYDLLANEPVTYTRQGPNDLVIDNENNLLYCPVFYDPGNVFYGVLELNLTTQAKRWITETSSPVNISSPILNQDTDENWGILRMYLDKEEGVLYFSTGNGVWWWNRSTNATGVYNMSGGIPLNPGNPSLPSNLTTGMFRDHTENKFYIGTHDGLFVWDRDNNTSKIYNTTNSKMRDNLVNHIDKNDEYNLIYVSLEEGGVFVLNTVTGEEKAIYKDSGSEVYPQYMDNSAASAFYDETDKKLYVSADHPTGGVWIQDYNNLIPDYGDLSLKAGSPAIDRGDNTFLPGSITTDINGLNRFVDFTNIFGSASLDLGAYERVYNADEEIPPAIPQNLALNYVLSYDAMREGITDEALLDNYPVKDVNRSIQYIDGLGRPMQSIAIQGSPSKLDVVQPIVYDEFGREAVKYLPFTHSSDGLYKENPVGTNSPQLNFYTTDNTPTIDADQAPYAVTVFEASPLNRVIRQGAPGEAWQPETSRTVNKEYLSNASQEVLLFEYDQVTGEISAEENGSLRYYDADELFVNKTIDEHQNEVVEYTDKEGRVVLKNVQYDTVGGLKKYASTYYVYDDLGNLIAVLPPEGLKQLLLLQN